MTSCSPASTTGFLRLIYSILLRLWSFVNYWLRVVIRFFSGLTTGLISGYENNIPVLPSPPGPKRGRTDHRNAAYAGGTAGGLCQCGLIAIRGFRDREDDDDRFAGALPVGRGEPGKLLSAVQQYRL